MKSLVSNIFEVGESLPGWTRFRRKFNQVYGSRHGKDSTTESQAASLRELLGCPPKSVLIVCKGNICRSPFLAGYLARHSLRVPTVFRSGGFRVDERESPPSEAVAAAKCWNVDLSSHVPRNMTAEDVKSADLVLAMEPMHYLEFAMRFFPMRRKFHLCGELGDPFDDLPVEDPFGEGPEVFGACYARLSFLGDRVIKALEAGKEGAT